MAWGKEWFTVFNKAADDTVKGLDIDTVWIEELQEFDKAMAADLASGVAFTKVTLDKSDTLKIEHVEAAKVYLNKVPTHDPYTNPNSHIYYECGCGDILDPGTKSFAALNGVASDKGWKIRFGPEHYIPYCVKCGEDVE